MKIIKKYRLPIILLAVFETVAVTLWLTLGNIFYLFNFSYIGVSVALGVFLYVRKYKHARRITQLLVGLYMLVYLGIVSNENMQIEGFWYYLFTGVFEAATIHYAVAKIFGGIARFRRRAVSFSRRKHRKNHVLVVYYRKCAVLRGRYYPRVRVQG